MEDIMLIRSSFLRRIISQIINKMLKKQLPGTEVQLGEVQANWSEKEQMDEMSFAAFIYPENKEEVLNELARSFEAHGETCPPRSK